jgi:magnesium-protoporphyrin O-methyltransferase
MPALTYERRRGEIEHYFDRTAVEAWSRLTSDAPVGRIRATVRAGRDRMRSTLLGWLPEDLRGARLLDAGCGTGLLALDAAARGADVVAVDLSATLIDLARQRAALAPAGGKVRFAVGDMSDPALGEFDFAVAMDSLIHYSAADAVGVVARLAALTRESVLFTFAPRTLALSVMHAAGRLFPRGDRAPAVEPVGEGALLRQLRADLRLRGWQAGRTERVGGGFYFSQALEMRRA